VTARRRCRPRWRLPRGGERPVVRALRGVGRRSFRMFIETGHWSSTGAVRADAAGPEASTREARARLPGDRPRTPSDGLVGRAQPLSDLGRALAPSPELFACGRRGELRPGGLVDALLGSVPYANGRLGGRGQATVPAEGTVLEHVMRGIGSIWPGRITLERHQPGREWWLQQMGPSPSRTAATKRALVGHSTSCRRSFALVCTRRGGPRAAGPRGGTARRADRLAD